MKLPLSISKRLSELVTRGSIPSSLLNQVFADKLISDGIMVRKNIGRRKSLLILKDAESLKKYLINQFGINDLTEYIDLLQRDEVSGREAVEVASNSKINRYRSFKGFLVNSIINL